MATREERRKEAELHGHEKRPTLKAIRAKCLDCCCHQINEVKLCSCTSCPLWPYRFGKNPFSERTGNPNAFKTKTGEQTC